MNHLTDEIITQLIDGSLERSSREDCLQHISECDICFVKHASLKVSHIEMTEADLLQTPHYLKKIAMSKLDLLEKVEEKQGIVEKFNSFISNILKPQSRLVPVLVTALLLVVVLVNIENDSEDGIILNKPSSFMVSSLDSASVTIPSEAFTSVSTVSSLDSASVTIPSEAFTSVSTVSSLDSASVAIPSEVFTALPFRTSENFNEPDRAFAYIQIEKEEYKGLVQSLSRSKQYKADVNKQRAYAKLMKKTPQLTLSQSASQRFDKFEQAMSYEYDGLKRHIMIPDLKLLNKATIVDSLYKLGLNYKFIYSNQNFKQVPPPGYFLAPKDTIYIYFGDSE